MLYYCLGRGGQDVKVAARKAAIQWFESTPRLQ